MTTERDLRNQMAYARKEAIEEGREEGREEERRVLLKNLLDSGMSVAQIASVTKIDEQEVIRITQGAMPNQHGND